MSEVIEPVRPTIYLVGDRESCGLGEANIACEIALMQIDPVTFEPVKEWHSLIDPQRDIPEEVVAIHGITNEMVVDAPTLSEFVQYKLNGVFDGYDIVMIAHNLPFDIAELSQVGTVTAGVCTLFWARQLVKDSPNHKLQTLREHFGFDPDGAHTARGDVRVTRQLLKELCRRYGRSLEQLAAVKDVVVHTMPWGKHKGCMIMQLPKSYLDWLLTECKDLEPNLRKSVEKARKLK